MALTLPGTGALALPSLTTGIPLLGGMFRNLKLSTTGTNASVTITCDAIVLESTGTPYTFINAYGVSLTNNTATVGLNGLDTGTLAASTWYSVWIISNGSTTGSLVSLSATAPTLPSGYTHRVRVGWIKTDGTANKFPISIIQFGRSVQFKPATGSNLTTFPLFISGSNAGVTTAYSLTGAIPTATASSVRVSFGVLSGVAGNPQLAIGPNSTVGANITNTMSYINQGSGAYAHASYTSMLLESPNIYYWSNTAQGTVYINGWEDNL